MAVGQDLELDVARLLDVALEVNIGILEGRSSLVRRGLERALDLALFANHAHASPSSAARGFEDDGEAHTPRFYDGVFEITQHRGAGKERQTEAHGHRSRRDLVAPETHRLRARADER